jgi:hypothetical protein
MMVGASGFEPPTSTSRTWRADQTALRPDGIIIGGFDFFGNRGSKRTVKNGGRGVTKIK